MSERSIRRVHEEGHVRKFLTVIDDTPECESSVYFAACRARSTNSKIVLLYVIEAEDFQHWLRVEEIHREEGEKRAGAVFRLYRRKLKSWVFEDIVAEELTRHGDRVEEILSTIQEDEDISFLVLGASNSSEGPGSLVSALAGKRAGSFPIPIVLIPEALEFREIEALS